MQTQKAIALTNLEIGYNKKPVVNGVNLEINAGEIVGLLGPSGCGKTTLIRSIMGMLPPLAGTVRVFGQSMPNRELLNRIGYMGQTDALYDTLTARENLHFFAQLRKMDRNDVEKDIERLAEVVNLTDFLDRRVSYFSGGMKRRLSLAITLLGDSDLLILDEPTVGIDPRLRIKIWEELKELAAGGKTILMTTHVMEDAEEASQLLMIRNGAPIANGSPAALKKQYNVDTVEEVFLKAGGK